MLSSNALPIGTRVHEFEISQVIGEGGFSVVYLAFDHTLHRSVALKEYIPSALASRLGNNTVAVRSAQHQHTFEAGLRSFINEARLLAQFDHPALVKVYRFWEGNGTAYMAMPFYEGRTLKQILREHPEQASEAWLKQLLAPILDALELLHGHRCYHRDIAPDNIQVLANEAPVLLDFGAARRTIGDMTQAFTVILKPGYAPIEQYADEADLKQGPWTDVYALAAVLYAAVVHKAPPTSVARIIKDPLVPLARRALPGYSEAFLSGIDRGLIVRPEERPQSIAALRDLLGVDSPTTHPDGIGAAEFAAQQDPHAEVAGDRRATPGKAATAAIADRSFEPSRRKQPRALWIGVAVAALLVVAPLMYRMFGTSHSEPVENVAVNGPATTVPIRYQAVDVSRAETAVAASVPAPRSMPVSVAPRTSVPESVPARTPAPKANDPTDPSGPVGDKATSNARPEPRAGRADRAVDSAAATLSVQPRSPSATVPEPKPTVNAPALAVSPMKPAAPSASAHTDNGQWPAATPRRNAEPVEKATVRILVQPYGDVYVDGKKEGVSPPAVIVELPLGRHRIEARNAGYEQSTINKVIDVTGTKSQDVPLSFAQGS